MSYIPALYGAIDPLNSTTTPLVSNGTFVGTQIDITKYASVGIAITVDQSSATYACLVQFSQDGTNWVSNSNNIVVTNAGTAQNYYFTYPVVSRYYRVNYTNGTSAQGVFRVQAILNAQTNQKTQQYTTDGISQSIVPARATAQGDAYVQISGSTSSFGDIRVANLWPLVQTDFVYGINSNNHITVATGVGSSVAGTTQLAVCTSGTANGTVASVSTKKYAKYRDGNGMLCRFTVIFTAGLANNTQIAGAGDDTDGYFVGYNGTAFGFLYRRNAVDTWTPQSQWNNDTFNGSGVDTNPSKFKLDPTKGNIYQIQLGYLGFANPKLSIYNPYSGNFELVHQYIYAGMNTVPILTNPALTLFWKTVNSGVTATPVVISASSGGIFSDGIVRDITQKYSFSSSKTNPGSTEIAILTIRNNTTVNGVTNKSNLKLISMTFAVTDSNSSNNANVMVMNIKRNATLGGPPAYTNTDTTNSISARDTAGTTVTGGTLEQSYVTCFSASQTIDVSEYDYQLYPGDTMTFSSVLTNSSANTHLSIAVNWTEQV